MKPSVRYLTFGKKATNSFADLGVIFYITGKKGKCIFRRCLWLQQTFLFNLTPAIVPPYIDTCMHVTQRYNWLVALNTQKSDMHRKRKLIKASLSSNRVAKPQTKKI